MLHSSNIHSKYTPTPRSFLHFHTLSLPFSPCPSSLYPLIRMISLKIALMPLSSHPLEPYFHTISSHKQHHRKHRPTQEPDQISQDLHHRGRRRRRRYRLWLWRCESGWRDLPRLKRRLLVNAPFSAVVFLRFAFRRSRLLLFHIWWCCRLGLSP